MNDITLTQLKIIVERVVRPIFASASRKQRIRDEMLVHMMAAFEEETAKDRDEQDALRRAIARFGNPGELTAQLQKSIPRSDRMRRIVDQLWSLPGESWWHRSLRRGLLIGVLIPVSVMLSWLIAGVPKWNSWPMTPANIAPQTLGLFLSALGFMVLAEWMEHALHRQHGRSWLELALVGVAGGVLFICFFIWMGSTNGGWAFVSKMDLLIGAGFGMLWTPAGLWTLARTSDARTRYEREWANLNIA